MFVQFKNHYRGDCILVNSDHIKYATPDRTLDGEDITLLQVGEDEIIVAHSLTEVHKILGVYKCV